MQKEGLANHSYLLYYLFLNSIYILTCLGFLLSHWKIQQSERQIKLTERENCTTATIPSWRPHSYSVIPGQLRSAVLTTNNLFLVFYRIRTLLPEPSTSIPPPPRRIRKRTFLLRGLHVDKHLTLCVTHMIRVYIPLYVCHWFRRVTIWLMDNIKSGSYLLQIHSQYPH